MGVRTLKSSFGGGEISPKMFGRTDDAKYQSGLATCRNFIADPQGPAENRTGFEFVRETKYADKPARLIPFIRSDDQTMIIELGDKYIRFHALGKTLMDVDNPTQPYELASPYSHRLRRRRLFEINYIQSSDVVTLVHPLYPPMELRRLSDTKWELREINFGPALPPPTGVKAVTSGSAGSNPQQHEYVVTSVAADGYTESNKSDSAKCSANLRAGGATVLVSWKAVGGASAYRVYRLRGGIYGYVGGTAALAIYDSKENPDTDISPPTYDESFHRLGNYPAATSYVETRRAFAGTYQFPQTVWMTRVGTESSISYSDPIKDDDRLHFWVAGRTANEIRHLVYAHHLVILTSATAWSVTAVDSGALTPSSTHVRPQVHIGATTAQPLLIDNKILYAAARGSHIYELSQTQQVGGLQASNLSVRAAHLFDDHTINDMTYTQFPRPIAWFTSSTGKLLGLTYMPSEQVYAWHQHDTTNGVFESCADIPEEGYDALYCVVKRELNGRTVRTIERMARRKLDKQEDAYFVDCGHTYRGAPATHISGLDILEGCTVSILADGAVCPEQVVKDGAVTLDYEASVVHIGLPIIAELKTPPLTLHVDNALGQGRCKNINKISLKVHQSSGVFAGTDVDYLTEAKQRTTEPCGSPPNLVDGEVEILIASTWGPSGQVYIHQSDPLPLTVVSMTMEVVMGD